MRWHISLLVYKFDVSLIYNVSNITIKKKIMSKCDILGVA